jgi:hypothetical protein
VSVVETLLSVERPPPCIPVRVSQDADGRWKKEPLAKWDCATTKRDMLEEWWLSWPDARPGIPLERVGWAVIDLDDYEDTAFRAAWVKPEKVVTRKGRSFIEPEHYSIYKTPSGGRHIVFAQPDPPLAGRMRWSPGVEVLGLGCLLTVYDVNAILYPRVAQRAVLPEVFRRPYAGKDAGRSHVYPRIKRSAPRDVAVVDVDVTNATAALWKMDPCDWRGDYDGWFHLAGACKAIGISRREFAKWSAGDPRYAADGRTVERIWESAKGAHGGAFYAALAARRIKVSAKRSLPQS